MFVKPGVQKNTPRSSQLVVQDKKTSSPSNGKQECLTWPVRDMNMRFHHVKGPQHSLWASESGPAARQGDCQPGHGNSREMKWRNKTRIEVICIYTYHIILQFLHRKLAFQYEKHSTTKKLSIHMSTLLSSQFVTAARFYHSKPPLAAPVFAPGRIDGEVLSHKACHKGHPWLRSHRRPSSCVSETKGCDSSVFQQDVHTCMHEYTYIYIYIYIYMYTYIVCTRTENQHMRWHYQILSHLDPYVNVIVYIYIIL